MPNVSRGVYVTQQTSFHFTVTLIARLGPKHVSVGDG